MSRRSGSFITNTPSFLTSNTAVGGIWPISEASQAKGTSKWPAITPTTTTPPVYSYTVANSLRFRSSASAYLSKTPASTGNQTTWTWSGWVKRGSVSTNACLFTAGPSSPWFEFFFAAAGGIYIQAYNGSSVFINLQTTPVYRDPSSWYHIVLVYDSTNATTSNRVRLYVNGSQVTQFSTATYPGQNVTTTINSSSYSHAIGGYFNLADAFDGYLAEINFIDGQALTPSSFGETNSTTGTWVPKQYSGTYGTNGFYLKFNNGSSTTTLGYDSSGNSNNWTTNNISLTSGSTYDWMLDSPTPVSSTVGNYAVLNPLDIGSASSLNSGNLNFTSSSASGFWYQSLILSNLAVSSGKWYWEISPTSLGGIYKISTGICNPTASPSFGTNLNPSYSYWAYDGSKFVNGTNSAYGASWGVGDIIGIALDLDAGTLTFYKNGVSQGVAATGISGSFIASASTGESGQTHTGWFNFGQRPFAYTPPTGFNGLQTYNLSTPTVQNGAQYFDVVLQNGNTTGRTISSLNFRPDLVWAKNRARSSNARWGVIDSVRGVNKTLSTALSDAEVTSQSDLLTSFNSSGFTIGADAGLYGWNGYDESWAHFCWKGGSTSVTNTSGTISSQVSANTTAGFSIVTYTGTGSTATVGHGLGVAPSMIILKRRNATSTPWPVYHSSVVSLANGKQFLLLNTTDAKSENGSATTFTSASSTTFGIGDSAYFSASSGTFVAYCFAAIAGYSAFGSYTGNGSSDGPFVYCGFRPRFVLVKRSDTTDDWVILDTSRNSYNVAGNALYPNSSSAETNNGWYNTDFISNGFKCRASNNPLNASSGTYIYAAFAENPFAYSNAR